MRRRKRPNRLDKALTFVATFLVAFVIATVIIYTVNGWQYDTLITCVLGAGGIEAIAGAFIQMAKYRRKDVDGEQDIV